MKKIATSVRLRAGVATALCLGLIIYLPVRVSCSGTAGVSAAAELKTESQLRSEASRYEGAIRAVGGIITMKLENLADLKSAIAILDRERPNLRFHFSRLVVLALSDSTYSSAVKKKSPNRAAAETLIKQMSANPAATLQIDGALSLQTRMQRVADTDAAVLRRAGERLKEAAERIRKTNQVTVAPAEEARGEFKLIPAGFSAHPQPPSETNTGMVVMPLDPASVAAGLLLALIIIDVVVYGAIIIKNVSTEEGRDAIAECQERADDRYLRCKVDANIFQQASCYASWLLDQGVCLVAPD